MTRPRLTVPVLGAVAAGGAVGAAARWLLETWAPDGPGFPWTTFAINVAGSFLLAALPAIAEVRHRPMLALALGPGILGGFTTLSAYAEQSRSLLAGGRPVLTGLYLVGTLAACLVAVHVGTLLSTPSAQEEFDEEEGNE